MELIDREFDNISHEVEGYAATIERRTKAGDLAVPIDSTSLMAYLKGRFGSLIEGGVNPTFNRKDKELVEELRDMGITKLAELDSAIPPQFDKIEMKYAIGSNFAGLLRNVMVVHDPDLYFEKAWKDHWGGLDLDEVDMYNEFGLDMKKYSKKYRFILAKVRRHTKPANSVDNRK